MKLNALLVAGLVLAGVGTGQAGPIAWYGVLKGREHVQTTSAPSTATLLEYGAIAYAAATEPDSIAVGWVQQGMSTPVILAPDSDDTRFLEAETLFPSEAELDAAYAPGTFNFTFITSEGGNIAGPAALGAAAYPAAPVLKNFAAAQDIDPAQPFTLQWDAVPGMTAEDFVVLYAESNNGDWGINTPRPWEPGALPGNTTSFTIPAGSFPEGGEYLVGIMFINVTTRSTGGIPEAVAATGYYSATEMDVRVRGGSGGDTTPPVMVMSSPMNGATGVAPSAVVSFTFTEAMQSSQTVSWSGLPNPGSMQYAWMMGGTRLDCSYPGGFPAGATVGWQLVPSGFRDLAGNALAPFQLTGQFQVGGNGGCQNGLDEQGDTFIVARFADFRQTSAAAPVPDSGGDDPAAGFFASFRPVTVGATGAGVTPPSKPELPLSGFMGLYQTQVPYTSEAELAAAYPAGTYGVRVTHGGGVATQSVTLGQAPPIPRCANYVAAQAVNPAQPFVLQWDAFTGAGPNDMIELTIWGNNQEVFSLPDYCANPVKPLAATATSATIPANVLEAGRTYDVTLNFIRASDSKTNSSPRFVVFAGYSRSTEFTIQTTGGNPNITPVITAYRVGGDGRFEVDVTASPGRTLRLEAKSALVGGVWSSVGSAVVPAGGGVKVRDNRAADLEYQVYRVRSE